ncbi:MAG: endonuclease III [Armatimonadetes bacterium]|nr:endonuclease III [Armatimonadota bacterium]
MLDPPDPARVRAILDILEENYPDARCSLDYSSPFELLVASILSPQCTDEMVNRVTARLFRKYRTPEDYARAPLAELEDDVRSTGFFRDKAKNLRAACRMLIEDLEGQVPQTIEELIRLPGVARKVANVILGSAFGIPSGFVVDTHVRRLTARLGLTESDRPERIEKDMCKIIPQEAWIDLAHRLVWHGRAVCQAKKPRCPECPLKEVCPSFPL